MAFFGSKLFSRNSVRPDSQKGQGAKQDRGTTSDRLDASTLHNLFASDTHDSGLSEPAGFREEYLKLGDRLVAARVSLDGSFAVSLDDPTQAWAAASWLQQQASKDSVFFAAESTEAQRLVGDALDPPRLVPIRAPGRSEGFFQRWFGRRNTVEAHQTVGAGDSRVDVTGQGKTARFAFRGVAATELSDFHVVGASTDVSLRLAKLSEGARERLHRADLALSLGLGDAADHALAEYDRLAKREGGLDRKAATELRDQVVEHRLREAESHLVLEDADETDASDRRLFIDRLDRLGMPMTELLELPSAAWPQLANVDAAMSIGAEKLAERYVQQFRKTLPLRSQPAKHRLVRAVLQRHHLSKGALKRPIDRLTRHRLQIADMLKGKNKLDERGEYSKSANGEAIRSYTNAMWASKWPIGATLALSRFKLEHSRKQVLQMEQGLRRGAVHTEWDEDRNRMQFKGRVAKTAARRLFRSSGNGGKKRFLPGRKINFRQMLSTSTDESMVREHFKSSVLMEIAIKPKLTKGRDISEISHIKSEREVLFPPNAVFKVVRVDRRPYPMEVDLVEVHDEITPKTIDDEADLIASQEKKPTPFRLH